MNMPFNQGKLIVYQTDDGRMAVDVRLEDETVWLTQTQIQELFDRERSVVPKHITNIFKEGEPDKNAVCVKFAHTAMGGEFIRQLNDFLCRNISAEAAYDSQNWPLMFPTPVGMNRNAKIDGGDMTTTGIT